MDASTGLKKYNNTAMAIPHHWPSWCRNISLSVLHSPQSGLNGLVDLAAVIFNHMPLMSQEPLALETKKKLIELVETLQQQYQQLDYSQDIALAAHYVVCATLDDILRSSGSHEGQFLQKFHNSRLEQEKFYSILDHAQSQPDKYIDLLELMYLCLRFGYKGQYRNTPFGLQQWSFITDTLYRTITQTRGQHSHRLSSSLTLIQAITPTKKITRKKRHHFYIITSTACIALIVATGFIFQQTYETTRDALITHEFISPSPDKEITT